MTEQPIDPELEQLVADQPNVSDPPRTMEEVHETISALPKAPDKIAERSFASLMEHLDWHAANGTPCKELAIQVAKYNHTEDLHGNEAPRPKEDTELRGWTAQQRHSK